MDSDKMDTRETKRGVISKKMKPDIKQYMTHAALIFCMGRIQHIFAILDVSSFA
jgi:hypothetical protein